MTPNSNHPPFLIQHEGNTYRLVSDSLLNDFLTRLYNVITANLFSRKVWQAAFGIAMIYLAENAGWSDQMLLGIGVLFSVLIGGNALEDFGKKWNANRPTVINAGTVESVTNTTTTPGTN